MAIFLSRHDGKMFPMDDILIYSVSAVPISPGVRLKLVSVESNVASLFQLKSQIAFTIHAKLYYKKRYHFHTEKTY